MKQKKTDVIAVPQYLSLLCYVTLRVNINIRCSLTPRHSLFLYNKTILMSKMLWPTRNGSFYLLE